MPKRTRATITGLLDAVERGETHHYIAERRTQGPDQTWSKAELLLEDLHTKGMVQWGETLIDTTITPKGTQHLKTLRAKSTNTAHYPHPCGPGCPCGRPWIPKPKTRNG